MSESEHAAGNPLTGYVLVMDQNAMPEEGMRYMRSLGATVVVKRPGTALEAISPSVADLCQEVRQLVRLLSPPSPLVCDGPADGEVWQAISEQLMAQPGVIVQRPKGEMGWRSPWGMPQQAQEDLRVIREMLERMVRRGVQE